MWLLTTAQVEGRIVDITGTETVQRIQHTVLKFGLTAVDFDLTFGFWHRKSPENSAYCTELWFIWWQLILILLLDSGTERVQTIQHTVLNFGSFDGSWFWSYFWILAQKESRQFSIPYWTLVHLMAVDFDLTFGFWHRKSPDNSAYRTELRFIWWQLILILLLDSGTERVQTIQHTILNFGSFDGSWFWSYFWILAQKESREFSTVLNFGSFDGSWFWSYFWILAQKESREFSILYWTLVCLMAVDSDPYPWIYFNLKARLLFCFDPAFAFHFVFWLLFLPYSPHLLSQMFPCPCLLFAYYSIMYGHTLFSFLFFSQIRDWTQCVSFPCSEICHYAGITMGPYQLFLSSFFPATFLICTIQARNKEHQA